MSLIIITSGPSREELFDGLRLLAEKRTISFSIEELGGNEVDIKVRMKSIQNDDGSGLHWQISFTFEAKILDLYFPDIAEEVLFDRKQRIEAKGYYSTHVRKGTIVIVDPTSEQKVLAELEKEKIKGMLAKHSGSIRNAAKELEISERSLYRKMKDYELEDA